MLSCVIIVCDKDYLNLPNIISDIKQYVTVDHEVIVMDNREQYKSEPLQSDSAKVVDLGYNAFQFEAKRQAVLNYISGDYVWFIDGDDRVTGCLTDFSEGHDIYSFNFTLKSGNTNYSHHYENEEIVTDCFTLSDTHNIGVVLWSKIIKLSILKDIFSKVPNGMKIHISEDVIIVFCAEYFSKSIKLCPVSCYEYNDIDCDSCNNLYTDIKKLERWTTGAKDVMKIFDMIVPKVVQNEKWIRSEDIYRNNLIDMLHKWFICDESIKDDFMRLVLKAYEPDFIQWVFSCWNPLEDKTNYDRLQIYDCFLRCKSTPKEVYW